MWNYAPCHLPHVDGQMDPSLAIVLKGLQCMLCGESCSNHMLVCDHYFRGWRIGCLTLPLLEVPIGHWVCVLCTKLICFVVSC